MFEEWALFVSLLLTPYGDFSFVTGLCFITKWPHCDINVTDRISVIERRIYQGTLDKPPTSTPPSKQMVEGIQ